VKHSSIRTFLSFVAMHNYELEQLDVKTSFLYGDLEEDIYMEHSEGFIVLGKKRLCVQVEEVSIWSETISKTGIKGLIHL
jgi:hypothetical protein